MEAILQAVDLKNIDRSNWKSYRFDEIAKNVSERVDPNNTDLKVYVGLEHIDSESLHIKRTGTPDDVNGTKLRCYPGDIIFGRRRAYQRKAAIATFDGFCSAHSLVLRANPAVIHPKLFPFFMHSGLFMNRAVDISVGSLSPTINWGTLKTQEFILPPIEEQEQLAELLWSMDDLIEDDKQVLQLLEITLNSYIKKIFTSHIVPCKLSKLKVKSFFQTKWEFRPYPTSWKVLTLKDVIVNFQNGFAEGKRDENGIPQLRMNNVTRDGRLDLSTVAMIPHKENIARYQINRDDVMFCNTNSEDLVGKSIIANDELEGFTFSNHFTRLRPDPKRLTPKLLYLWLKYHFDIGLFQSRCTKWIGQAAVQSDSLMKLEIILPPLEEQKLAERFCIELEKRIDEMKSKLEASKALQKSIVNQVFG
jgi:type I restriction enzyme S subunit